MAFRSYVLTISFNSVEKEVEIYFYCFPGRVHKVVERFLNRYDLDDVHCYTVCSL